MRVLLLALGYGPVGGAENVVWELSRRYAASSGVDSVTVGCSAPQGPAPPGVELVQIRRDGPPLVRFRRYVSSGLEALGGRRFDVIHAHSLPTPGKLGLALKEVTGAPLVVTVHGSEVYKLSRRPLMGRWNRQALEGADAVTGVSSDLCDAVWKAHGVRCVCVPGGVDVATFRPPAGKDRAKSGPLRVLYVGGLTKKKDVASLVRALAVAGGKGLAFRATLVGDGPERGRLAALAARLGIADRVELVGRLDDRAALANIYRRSDLFVLPSRTEALGLVVLEAMASALAVVATDVGGVHDAVSDGRTGLLVPSGDPAAMAGAMSELASDPARRGRMGLAGRAAVEKRFTWERATGAYLDVLKRAARKRI